MIFLSTEEVYKIDKIYRPVPLSHHFVVFICRLSVPWPSALCQFPYPVIYQKASGA